VAARRGLQAAASKWTALLASPLRGRQFPVAVWNHRRMFVWGGYSSTGSGFTDGAVFTPTRTDQGTPGPLARSGPNGQAPRTLDAVVVPVSSDLAEPVRLGQQLSEGWHHAFREFWL
jgi:hypothetical protein